MSAMQHGEIFQCDIFAKFQADSLISHSRQTTFFTSQPTAIDQSGTANSHIFNADSPDQGVFPMAMTKVLITVMFVRLSLIISTLRSRRCRYDACTLFQIKMNMAGKPYRIAGIFSGRDIYGSTTFTGSRRDGTINSRRINGHPVGPSSIIFHIMDGRLHQQHPATNRYEHNQTFHLLFSFRNNSGNIK